MPFASSSASKFHSEWYALPRSLPMCGPTLCLITICQAQASAVGEEVVVKSWRKVHGEVYETWSSFTVKIDDSKPPEAVELKDEQSGLSVAGQRLRLQVVPCPSPHHCTRLMHHHIFEDISNRDIWIHHIEVINDLALARPSATACASRTAMELPGRRAAWITFLC